MESISPELLAMLACPVCKGPLALLSTGTGLSCARCEKTYPIKDGIPDLIV